MVCEAGDRCEVESMRSSVETCSTEVDHVRADMVGDERVDSTDTEQGGFECVVVVKKPSR
jgi:hypothetical protein